MVDVNHRHDYGYVPSLSAWTGSEVSTENQNTRAFENQHQKIKAIGRILNKYPAAFANKLKALAMIAEFNQQSEELSELISQLLRPASIIHRPKQDSQQKLVASLYEFLGMGILLASHLGDMPLLDILKVYKSRIRNVSAYKLFEMAVHVVEELEKKAGLKSKFSYTEHSASPIPASASWAAL